MFTKLFLLTTRELPSPPSRAREAGTLAHPVYKPTSGVGSRGSAFRGDNRGCSFGGHRVPRRCPKLTKGEEGSALRSLFYTDERSRVLNEVVQEENPKRTKDLEICYPKNVRQQPRNHALTQNSASGPCLKLLKSTR